MLERKVNNLILTGEDARWFAHSLYHPSREHIIRQDRILDDIKRNISLAESPNGFSAEIKDLDLGFLKSEEHENAYEVDVCLDLLDIDIYNKCLMAFESLSIKTNIQSGDSKNCVNTFYCKNMVFAA